jgi:hypothetical protein
METVEGGRPWRPLIGYDLVHAAPKAGPEGRWMNRVTPGGKEGRTRVLSPVHRYPSCQRVVCIRHRCGSG